MTTSEHGPTLAELARRFQDLTIRFEQIATRIETAYVTKEFFEITMQLMQTRHESLQQYAESLRDQSHKEIKDLRATITDLEEDKTWLFRLVVGAVILAFMGVSLAGAKAIGN